ncbi:MAG: PorV/PorQ family protein [Candidatus Cloacimonadota bacterium]|nr:MAG: PorV/PorQ family protein [Candidatus Cloacimonadota bacterium]
MKRYVFSTILLFVSTTLFAWEGGGTKCFEELGTAFGVRASAMGESFVGLSNDYEAIWWNPGGLGTLRSNELAFIHHIWFEGIRDEFFSFVHPLYKGAISTAIIYTSYGSIEGYDLNNNSQGEFTPFKTIFLLSYARRMNKKLCFGIGLKGLYESIDTYSGKGVGFDLGIHFKKSELISFGASLRNLSPGVSYSTGEKNQIPMDARVGISISPSSSFNLTGETVITTIRTPTVHFGFEYWLLKEKFAIRGGYKTGPQSLEQLGAFSGMTSGMGIVYGKLHFDYVFIPYSKLGMTHRLSLVAKFGQLKELGSAVIKIVDKETSEPICAGLKLSGVMEADEDSVLGEYSTKSIPIGYLYVEAEKEDYYGTKDSIKIEFEEKKELTIAIKKFPPGFLTGKIYDVKTEEPLGGTIYFEGPATGTIDVSPDIGSFKIDSLPSGIYELSIKPEIERYIAQKGTVEVALAKETIHDFALLKRKETIILKGIHFTSAKADLLPESFPRLDYTGKILKDNPGIVVELAGHTDTRPIHTEEFPSNMELSQARSQSVKDYLVEKFNIDPERLIAKGYGPTQPIATNKTEEGMAKNRRTEFRVIKAPEDIDILTPKSEEIETPILEEKDKGEEKESEDTEKEEEKKPEETLEKKKE